LNTDQRDDCPAIGTPVGPDNLVNRQFLHRVIENFNLYLEIIAKNPAAVQIFCKTAETGKGVAWKHAAQMTDDISVVIIFGGLDQDNRQEFTPVSFGGGLPSHDIVHSHTQPSLEQPTTWSGRPKAHPSGERR